MCHLKWCVVFSACVFIPIFGEGLEDRVIYLEHQLNEDIPTLKRELFGLKMSVNKIAKQGGVSGKDVPVQLAKRVKQMEDKIDTFLTKQRKDYFSLRTGVEDLKQNTHDQFEELKALATNKAEILSINDKLSKVTQKIENEEKERGELKREMNDEIKLVIDELDKKVNLLKVELEEMVQQQQNVSASSIVLDGRELLLTPCPENWIQMGQKCYLYSPDDLLDWHAATVKCSMVGGKLAEPETATEMKAVLRLVGNNVWIGATDAANEGTWVWDSSQKPASHLDWEKNQPNNVNDSQHCLEVFKNQVNDEGCHVKNEYICERKPSRFA